MGAKLMKVLTVSEGDGDQIIENLMLQQLNCKALKSRKTYI